jgi:hypothetical protein
MVAGPYNGAGLRVEGVECVIARHVARCDQHLIPLRSHLRQGDETPVTLLPQERAVTGPARFDTRWFNLHDTLVSMRVI